MQVDDERKIYRTKQGSERIEQEIVAPDADQQTGYAAKDRQEQAFAKQLAHDSPARRAESETQRDLFRTRGAASE